MERDKLFYTVKDLADMLGCGEENVRKLARKGYLPARKLGKKMVFLKDELETALKELPHVNPYAFGRGK